MILEVARYKKDEIVPVQCAYSGPDLELELHDVKYLKPLAMSGEVERVDESLLFRGKLETRLEMICMRCAEAVQRDFAETFDLYFEIEGRENVDATDEIRETMLLSYPEKFLCAENCKGLCQQCGHNLNTGPCSCASEMSGGKENPFGKLKDWGKK